MVDPSAIFFTCPLIVGRERELALASQYLAGGTARVLAISGETGIGKSRLAREILGHALQAGLQTGVGCCFEAESRTPYALLQDLLRQLAPHPGLRRSLAQLGPATPHLDSVFPESLRCSPGPPAIPATHPEHQKSLMFQAALELFTTMGQERSLLLLLEDLHWSDEASLELLLFLVRRFASPSILLLLTYRIDEVTPALETFLAELERERLIQELVLSPLRHNETETMIGAIFGEEGQAPQGLLDAIFSLTEGNPFFIEEVVKAMAASGDVYHNGAHWAWRPPGGLHIPRSVNHAVQRRMHHLTPRARGLVQLAAVAGRRFNFPVLRRVTGLSEGELLDLIKELIQSQLVAEESDDQFAFRHALTQQAIYTRLLLRERRRLHQIIGETMETLYGPESEQCLPELAYHFRQARVWDRVRRYSRRMGQRALRLYSPLAASEHLTAALEATTQLRESPPLELWLERSQACLTMGDFDRARTDLESGLCQCQESGDRQGEWRTLVELGRLWSGQSYHRAGDYFQRALGLALDRGDRQTAAHSLNWLGNWHLNTGEPEPALHNHRQALATFQELDHHQGIADTLDLLGVASFLSGDLVTGTMYYHQAARRFQEQGNHYGLSSVLGTLQIRGSYLCGTLVCPAEQTVEGAENGQTALKLARDIGWRAGEAYAGFNLASWLGPQGRYEEALTCARDALSIAQEIGHQQWTTGARCVLGAIHLDLLAVADAIEHLELALKLARETGSANWTYNVAGFLLSGYAQQGAGQQARELEEFLAAGANARSNAGRQFIGARAELAHCLGQGERALELLDGLVQATPNLSADRPVPLLSRLRGEVLMGLRRWEEAEPDLLAAQSQAASLGMLSEVWRAHLSLGRLYRAVDRRSLAIGQFTAARELVGRLAAGLPDTGLRDTFLAGAYRLIPPVPPPTPGRLAREAAHGLTPREREVAQFIVKGFSNRQIAETLVIGERTVETHVSNMMAKLGVSSRVQLASWMAEKGLSSPSNACS